MSCDENAVGEILMPDGSELSYDGLASIDFRVLFPKIPNTVFFLQSFNIPGISINKIVRPTPFLDIDEIGEKPIYEPFSITFLVDKNVKNYREIYDWIMRIVTGPNHRDETCDAMLIINNKQTVRFAECWPASISGMQFAANATNMEYLTATVVFNYDWYEFI